MVYPTLTPGLQSLGWTPFHHQRALLLIEQLDDPEAVFLGRVVAEHRGELSVADGETVTRAVLAGRLIEAERPCVGDFVLARAGSRARIEAVLERQSVFRRRASDGSSRPQAIAANVDLAFVVAALAAPEADPHALQHGLNLRRIERYLAAVHEAGVTPLVVVNKSDLRSDVTGLARELEASLGSTRLLCVSAQSGAGLDELRAAIAPGMTAVLVGSSGVGKSSLVNALLGRDEQRTGSVRTSDTRGRHTTTHRALFVIPNGGLLIDTPGMRELGLFAEDGRGAGAAFEDIEQLRADCQFSDCQHHREPGCAVLAALARGELSDARLEHHRRLARELDWQQRRYDVFQRQAQRTEQRARNRALRLRLREKGRS